ncbi:hypothetical protein F4778DRAFT_729609 [Xylariomycetidae sp. FL2044]|nr:hypothetical protein F4778DRAFT_729609 [Xylariomycetidae sp. FL2044]
MVFSLSAININFLIPFLLFLLREKKDCLSQNFFPTSLVHLFLVFLLTDNNINNLCTMSTIGAELR